MGSRQVWCDLAGLFRWKFSLVKQDFLKAKETFDKLSLLWDSPSKTYTKRCEMYLKSQIDDSWDWVWNLDEK